MEKKEKLFDGIHPNEIGHEVWSKYIKNFYVEKRLSFKND